MNQTTADVIVVGAGPGGSTAGYYLAQAGLNVIVLEKSAFPREKVCGDGLTPRAVKQLIAMGIDISSEAGWVRNKGLRIFGGGHRLELAWPELASFPDFGLTRTRADFDHILAQAAEKAGATLLQQTPATGPVLDEDGRLIGVTATQHGEPVEFRAPLIIAADGNSSRLSLSMDLQRRDDRPMGVAVRRYFRSPRTNDDYLESWLELWDGKPGQSNLLPGYGWIFGLGDGRCNVGLGILNTTSAFGKTDYRDLLARWLDATPEDWGFREANADGPVRGAALPMGFNRTPVYTRGLLLVGDACGAVNPFNGEGIAYAMETAKIAAETAVQALARPAGTARELALHGYQLRLRQEYGKYYRLGKVFVNLIGHPGVMRPCARYGLGIDPLMRLLLKLMANLTDPVGGDASDRILAAVTKLARPVL